VLSDRERQALEELERCYVMEEPGPVMSGRSRRPVARRANHPPGTVLATGLACVSVALLCAGAPAAGLALAVATGICWLYWRAWAHRADAGGITASLLTEVRRHPSGPESRLDESLRRFLRWMGEAEP
jgi:hypothetical protein